MEIGDPRRIYVVEPIEDPVPQEAPADEPVAASEPPEPEVVPAE
jgi:hypothetical protein